MLYFFFYVCNRGRNRCRNLVTTTAVYQINKHMNKQYDNDLYCDVEGYYHRRLSLAPPCFDKDQPFETNLHYSDPTANQERTVFGAPKKGLFYNYSDRLYGKKWDEGWKLAKEQAALQTIHFFEIALNHFHDSDNVDLQHVILGCNRSTGYSYLIFGYTYTSKSNK